jgi:hypothetical protein
MQCCSQSPWEVLGHFLNALIVQQKRWTFPTLEKEIDTASSTYTVYTVYKTLCPNGERLERKQPTAEARIRI